MRKHFGAIYRGIIGFLTNLIERTPKISKKIGSKIIGYSVSDRGIECFSIGNGPRHILLAAAIHGNEVGTVKLSKQILVWASKRIQEFPNLTFHIIPILNPDGYEMALRNPEYFQGGRMGRVNAHDVDLNRNFPTRSFNKESVWCYGKNYSEKERVYCGEYGGSEPEIQALLNLIRENRVSVLWMLHSAGGDVMGNRNDLSRKLLKLFNQKTGFRLVEEGDWEKLGETGTAAEWCDEQNLTYVEVEGSTRWSSDWKKQKEGIISILRYLNII